MTKFDAFEQRNPDTVAGLFCLDCAGKHLGQARRILDEILGGRWNDARHRMDIRGHMGEAEGHLGCWTDLGKRCRALRVEIEQLIRGDVLREPGEVIKDFVYLYEAIENKVGEMTPDFDLTDSTVDSEETPHGEKEG